MQQMRRMRTKYNFNVPLKSCGKLNSATEIEFIIQGFIFLFIFFLADN
jgi:hypothetical protein